jgi:hypothetical protein
MLDANGKSSSTIKLPSAAAVLSDPPFTSSESAGATGAGTNKQEGSPNQNNKGGLAGRTEPSYSR